MNRRTFFKKIGLLSLIPFVPKSLLKSTSTPYVITPDLNPSSGKWIKQNNNYITVPASGDLERGDLVTIDENGLFRKFKKGDSTIVGVFAEKNKVYVYQEKLK